MGRLLALVAAMTLSANAAHPMPAAITQLETPAGRYLIDAKGFTLYTFTGDVTPGVSLCKEECAIAWPPLDASTDGKDGEFQTIRRDDGSRQWTWRGKPLYRHARDLHAGARLGEAIGGAWQVAFDQNPLPAGLTTRRTLAGRVIADSKGFTMYWRLAPAAELALMSDWTPAAAPFLAKAVAPWSVVERPDGTRQWAYGGRPLFRYAHDTAPGMAKGEAAGEEWGVALLEPPAPRPSWVTVQTIETGLALADARGHTLYVVRNMDQVIKEKVCLEECMRTFWRPALAAVNDQPVGNWTIIVNPAGERQWHFNGAAVFTHTRDQKPGDSTGAGFGVGQGVGNGWRPIMLSATLPPS